MDAITSSPCLVESQSFIYIPCPTDAKPGNGKYQVYVFITLAYSGGQIAQLTCAIRTQTAVEATLFGSEGSLTIGSPWYCPSHLTLARTGHEAESLDIPYAGNGYNYEAEEAGRCLREGLLESPTMPLDETLQIVQTLDRIRAPWPVTYPGDV